MSFLISDASGILIWLSFVKVGSDFMEFIILPWIWILCHKIEWVYSLFFKNRVYMQVNRLSLRCFEVLRCSCRLLSCCRVHEEDFHNTDTHTNTTTNTRQWRTQEFCSGGGGSTNSVEDRGQRERGSGGGSPLVRGSGGSCNLVQEISFHIVKF